MIEIDASVGNLPLEIQEKFEKIDQEDCNKFVDGINTESPSYQYFNSLNQFRYEQNVSIFLAIFMMFYVL